MAGANSKEAKYRAQLENAGIWCDAFEAAVHDLCILERRRSRAMKDWNATAQDGKSPSISGATHDALLELEKEIFKQREKLGLTPSGMRKLKPPEENVSRELAFTVVISGGEDSWSE